MINANSSLLYYYLFKAFLLFDIDHFLEWIIIPDNLCLTCKPEITKYVQLKLKKIINSSTSQSYMNDILELDECLDDHLNMMGIKYQSKQNNLP